MKTLKVTFPDIQVLRFILNGVVATLVHYTALRFLLDVAGFRSAGVSNLAAACLGIACSFAGSRYFVFQNVTESWRRQFGRFAVLYGVLALTHGAILYVWTDRLGLDASVGFLIALSVQTCASYLGNKHIVFK